jgi:hypothetical protein
MATNKSSKKTNIKTAQQFKEDKSIGKGVAKDEKQGLMDIAEVRMVLYVVPVGLILALFVYFMTR